MRLICRSRLILVVFVVVAMLGATKVSAIGVNTRPTIALVLGGGAARGLSHIGLLQALEEEGIPIDYLIGTSMGSVVAGLYAGGLSVENIEYLISRIDLARLFSPGIPPQGGFVRTERFERFIDEILQGKTFENASIPFYSVITNLITGEEVGLNTGPISRGIVASMSIPGMFPPVEIDGSYFVDGGIKSPVPVDFARKLGADVVIAVDVRRTLETIDHDNLLTNLQLTLFFLLDANTEWQLDLADVIVAPQVESDSYMDYDRASHFIAEGYEAGIRAIPQIREVLHQKDPKFPFGMEPVHPGVSEAIFEQRVGTALREITSGTRRVKNTPYPGLTLRAGESLGLKLGLDVPLRLAGRDPFAYVGYWLQGKRNQPVHTIGVEVAGCQLFCPGVFARRASTDSRWNPGISLVGSWGHAFQYGAEWEMGSVLSGADASWRLNVTAPMLSQAVESRRDFQLQVMHDSRGLYGSKHDDIAVEAMARFYFPGEAKNVLELLRGTAIWYVGAGAGARFSDQGTSGIAMNLSPRAETGVILEGQLFGLYPIRTRLSLLYSGGSEPWVLRWTIGD